MGLLNEREINKKFRWLVEKIKCLEKDLGGFDFNPVGLIQVPLPFIEKEVFDIFNSAVSLINNLPKFELTGQYIPLFYTKIGDTFYTIGLNKIVALGEYGLGAENQVAKENLFIVSKEKDFKLEDVAEGLRYLNTDILPATNGGYIEGGPATSEDGLNFQETIDKLLYPPVNPEVTFNATGNHLFKQPSISNSISWSVTVKSVNAEIATLSLDYKRSGSSTWINILQESTLPFSTSFTHNVSGNTTNEDWDYRLRVIDTKGAETSVQDSVTMGQYQSPDWDVSFAPAIAAPFYEIGEPFEITGNSITRQSLYVPILGYSYRLRFNSNNSTDQVVVTNNLSPEGGALAPYTFANGDSDVDLLMFNIDLQQDGSPTSIGYTTQVGFRKASYFGWSTRETWNSAITGEANMDKLLLTSKSIEFTNVNPGSGDYVFYIYPASYEDLSTLILNGSTSFDLSQGEVFTKIEDSVAITNQFGVTLNYKVYRTIFDNAFTGSTLNFS